MIIFDNDIKIQYISSGLFKTEMEWIHPERIIDSHEIIFVSEGTVYITEEDTEYELHKNDMLFLEAGKKHFGHKETNEPVSFYWFHFMTEDISNLPKNISINEPFSLITMLSQLLHITNTPGYSKYCGDMICGLLLQEFLFLNRISPNKTEKLAVQIKEWVRINADRNISVKDVAEYFQYNESHINRIFKIAYGTSIKQYIIDIRLNKAKILLQTSLYNIKQIAYIMGYENENLFVKFFEYHIKMTPTEYRQIYINTHTNKN